ncbi:TonB-dependent receptor [Bacteroides fragilis]|jgi:outer membrane receptor for ferrienterochelin and colicins|uniref:TonB-dependent receptor n=1 Tax=Bacteroides fragilis TaxID=817 RepID=UPI000818C5DC|nr:TonB-dependent receptor [Bacteroides fragilis]MBV3958779.1 TonB-dependent receptor [Bacteroides fragilis]MBV3962950.1 TonB-dependent receptor [Bacteroides fragilis]MCE8707461.1 TonB-dependent receptor [Bacteroides fragilis]MCE9381004.1 TonB-dependent receptor [Bacteroides fragilis]MCE9390423.1 TonB-dependent receptor [Bacteroides fragilis]
MKRVTTILFLMLLICVHTAAQQKVKLEVLEKGTEQPIIAANVIYADNEALRNPQYAITNTSGQAELKLPSKGICYYKVTYIGYVPVTGKIGGTQDEKVIYMKEDDLGINEVVVTGSRTARPIKMSPVTTQVLGGKALVDAGYSNLQQALQQETPGLNIQKVGFGNEISMQGLDARHVLFLMDGERMTGDMAGNLDYERFNLHAIDRVEIVKGASSTLYGSRAAGAVINLITKKTDKPLSIDAGIRYGQMNERNYKHPQPKDFLYMFEQNADRPNLQSWVSAGFKTGKFTSQTDVWYSESDAFYMYQAENDKKVYTKEANPFLPHDITVVSNAVRPPMGIEGKEHITVSQKLYYNPNPNLSVLIYGSSFFMNTYDLIQDMTFSQARDWTAGTKVTYHVKDWFSVTGSLHADFYDRFKRHERIDKRQKDYESSIYQPRLTVTSNYFNGHSLILGMEHTSDELTSDRFSGNANHDLKTRALKETEYFLQDEWTINPRWMISAGIRTNFSKAFGFMGMPKVAAKYSPDKHWSLRANYSMGYRSPSIKELFFNWDHLGMFMIRGNENMRPEKNNYFSLGAEYSNDRLFVSGTAYGNYFRDKIEGVWRIYDMQYNFEYTNLSQQRLLGLEVLARWSVLDCLTLNGTYSFVDVSKNKGIQVNTTSPHAATASMDYKYMKKNYRLNAVFSASYMGGKKFDVQDRVFVKEENKSYDAYFRCDLPQYVLCNLSVSQTFWNKVKLTLGMDNLFNYVPKTLGSGITMFNVPATAGARGWVQVEFMLDDVINSLKKKK